MVRWCKKVVHMEKISLENITWNKIKRNLEMDRWSQKMVQMGSKKKRKTW